MVNNLNLLKARMNAKDEFYTQYQDIRNEISHYKNHFRGKTIYCNCDNPEWSNFWIFFHANFTTFGLYKLIATHYTEGAQESSALVYEGGDDLNMKAGEVIPIQSDEGYPEKEKTYCAGDFRSQDCIKFLEEADIVCTNPPFSLFREYVAQLNTFQKHFLIIGHQNAITYKEIFPLIKDNKMWLGFGFKGGAAHFINKYYEDYATASNHKEGMIRVSGVVWYTNLDIKKRHDGLWHKDGKFDQTINHNYYEGFEKKYPKYDNYDAINVDKTKEIPVDYPGVMGVPITWLNKYSQDEFDIIGITSSWDESDEMRSIKTSHIRTERNRPIITGKQKYSRILIRNRYPRPRCEMCIGLS